MELGSGAALGSRLQIDLSEATLGERQGGEQFRTMTSSTLNLNSIPNSVPKPTWNRHMRNLTRSVYK